MFHEGNHAELLPMLEAIGANFAIYEYCVDHNTFRLVSCNSLYEDILGTNKESVLEQSLEQLFPRYISEVLHHSFNDSRTKEVACESEFFIDYKANERWWRSVVSPIILAPDHSTARIIQTCVEITEKKQLEKTLDITMKRYQAIVQTAYDGIITIDNEQNIKLINQAAQAIFSMKQDEGIGLPLKELIPARYRQGHNHYIEGFRHSRVDSRPMQTRASVRGLRRDGSEFPVEVTISKIKVDDNVEMTAVIRDISERNQLLEELVSASQEDSLTKLYNRRQFTHIIEQEISRTSRYLRPFSLLMLDIDKFKQVNDKHGHEAGDEVLIHIANMLKENTRTSDACCRWGGEEFLVLLPETLIEDACILAEKIRLQIEITPTQYLGEKFNSTVSIGVKTFTSGDNSIKEAISHVDSLMYKAKNAGRNIIIADK